MSKRTVRPRRAPGVLFSRTVAALAIDSRRQPSIGFRRIAVMTEQTLIGDRAAEVEVCGVIVARAHGPTAPALRIPAQRKLNQPALRTSMYEGTSAIAGTNDEIDPLLYYVDFCTRPVKLVPSLKPFFSAAQYAVMAVRGAMVERGFLQTCD